MKRSDLYWLISVMLVHVVLGQVLFFWLGLVAWVAWMSSGLLLGYLAGEFMKRRVNKAKLEEWRVKHPDMPDCWIPKHLKD